MALYVSAGQEARAGEALCDLCVQDRFHTEDTEALWALCESLRGTESTEESGNNSSKRVELGFQIAQEAGGGKAVGNAMVKGKSCSHDGSPGHRTIGIAAKLFDHGPHR